MPGTCADETRASCRVLGGLGARARPFRTRAVPFWSWHRRIGAKKIYWVRQDGRYLEEPGAHKLKYFRCALANTYFPAPTSAPGTLQVTKPLLEGRRRVPGRLTYPVDTPVTVDGRLGCSRAPGCSPPNQQAPKPQSCQNHEQQPVAMGRSGRDACRRAPREGLHPRWSM